MTPLDRAVGRCDEGSAGGTGSSIDPGSAGSRDRAAWQDQWVRSPQTLTEAGGSSFGATAVLSVEAAPRTVGCQRVRDAQLRALLLVSRWRECRALEGRSRRWR